MPNATVDLTSDTVTQPTPAMLSRRANQAVASPA